MSATLRTSTLRVTHFLAALAAAGLHERVLRRAVCDEDFDADWMRLAVWPPARRRNPGEPLVFNDLLRAAERQFGVAPRELLGRRRTRGVVAARFAVWRACRDELGWSTPYTGKRFGRDHSTIVHGLSEAQRRGLKLELTS